MHEVRPTDRHVKWVRVQERRLGRSADPSREREKGPQGKARSRAAGEERAVGRIKERARILRRLLRLRPWPLALAMLMLGVAAVLVVGISGLIRAAISPAFAPVCPEGVKICWAAPQLQSR